MVVQCIMFDDEHHPSSISVDILKFIFVNLNQLVIVPTVFISPEFMMRLFQNYVHFLSTKKTIELESVLSSGYVRLILHFITFLTDRSLCRVLVKCKWYPKRWWFLEKFGYSLNLKYFLRTRACKTQVSNWWKNTSWHLLISF